mmetsp:Transcript_13308/g.33279  ORF Transcript_13308/g.33279 Transcript_13308/m.33279 type:complete len:252 (-) Transcript_13308:350-1105(-)
MMMSRISSKEDASERDSCCSTRDPTEVDFTCKSRSGSLCRFPGVTEHPIPSCFRLPAGAEGRGMVVDLSQVDTFHSTGFREREPLPTLLSPEASTPCKPSKAAWQQTPKHESQSSCGVQLPIPGIRPSLSFQDQWCGSPCFTPVTSPTKGMYNCATPVAGFLVPCPSPQAQDGRGIGQGYLMSGPSPVGNGMQFASQGYFVTPLESPVSGLGPGPRGFSCGGDMMAPPAFSISAAELEKALNDAVPDCYQD